ncbi:MAG: hypothetical protein CMJ51_04140 [Planctomycetaceae bacterium]|nr:hypothetical protein [Planctomycetaceae bacterium]
MSLGKITRTDGHRDHPMTDIQAAYWVGRRDDVAGGGFSTHVFEEIESVDLDLGRFERAWNQVVARHEALRTVVSPEGRIRIHDKRPFHAIPHDDLRNLNRAEQEDRLQAIRDRHLREVLPTDTWPLWRVRTARLTNRLVRVFLSFDAIPCDARSRSVMYRDWRRLYEDPRADLEPLGGGFGDFLEAAEAIRETDAYRGSKAFWATRLPEIPAPPLLPVGNDREQRRPGFARLATTLSAERWCAFVGLAERLEATPTALLAAVYSRVLASWSADPRFHLVLTIFERLGRDARYQNVMGDYTSTLVLSVDCSSRPEVGQLARRIRSDLKALLAHGDYSGVRVLRDLATSGRRFPANAVPCVLTSTVGSKVVTDTEWRTAWIGRPILIESQTPQVGIDCQAFEIGGELCCSWDHSTQLVPPTLAAAMFRDFESALEQVVDEANLPELTDRSVGTSAFESRGTESRFLHDDIERHACDRPDAPAIITDDRLLSYREMAGRAMAIARRLDDIGVDRDELVAIVMDKGWEQIVAALGIQLAGAAYLPIDATIPIARVRHILERGEVACVLTTSDLVAVLDLPAGLEVVDVDQAGELDEPLRLLREDADPDDLAYVIFTSGSTGEPKGVAMTHRATRNTIDDVNDRLDVRSSDRLLTVSSLSFDLSVYDIFGPLSRGAAVVIPSPARAKDPSDWARLLARHHVTLWNSVPTLAQLLVEQFENRPETAEACRLRTIMMSGDWIPTPLPDQLRRAIPGVEIISMGGATEAAIWSVIHHVGAVDPSWRSIPYGRAMRQQTIEVRDDSLRKCGAGEIGEIVIGGVGLARGYWRDEVLTNASFVTSPEGHRIYRTGDLGRCDDKGRIEFLGRIDQQVKVRGFRIEIGEVEHAILEHPAIANCIVKAAGPPCGERKLVAYVVPSQSKAEPDVEAIRNHVADRLPDYMVPANWHWVAAIPTSANGKVDRAADLDALVSEWSVMPDAAACEPGALSGVSMPVEYDQAAVRSTATETDDRQAFAIATIAADVLGISGIHPDADLIDLGANSVDVIRIVNRIETTLGGVRPQLDDVYGDPTPLGIARLLGSPPSSLPAATTSSGTSEEEIEMIRDPADRQAFRRARKGRRPDADTLEGIVLAREPDSILMRERTHRRRSYRFFDQNPLEFDRLGRILETLANVGEDGLKFRYGSAGGLYPVQTYLIARPGRIAGLERGVYYLDQYDHQLRRLGDAIDYGPELYDRFVNGPIVRSCAFALMFALRAEAIEPMYGSRAHEYALIEAGLMAQLLETEGPRENIGFTQIGSMDYGPLPAMLGLGARDRLVYSMLGGGIPAGDPPRFFSWKEGTL